MYVQRISAHLINLHIAAMHFEKFYMTMFFNKYSKHTGKLFTGIKLLIVVQK